jgi:hypothetical protein
MVTVINNITINIPKQHHNKYSNYSFQFHYLPLYNLNVNVIIKTCWKLAYDIATFVALLLGDKEGDGWNVDYSLNFIL